MAKDEEGSVLVGHEEQNIYVTPKDSITFDCILVLPKLANGRTIRLRRYVKIDGNPFRLDYEKTYVGPQGKRRVRLQPPGDFGHELGEILVTASKGDRRSVKIGYEVKNLPKVKVCV